MEIAGDDQSPARHAVAITLIHGNASAFTGDADLILTNSYAPLPPQLRRRPMILTNFSERKEICEFYAGGELQEIGAWSRGLRCKVWVRNLPRIEVNTSDLIEEEDRPGCGWFPLDLPLRLLGVYAKPGMTIWDGFMGRGTVGKACRTLGMNFIGIDIDPKRVDLAREYIGC